MIVGNGVAMHRKANTCRCLNAMRTSVNMISATTNQGKVRFKVFDGSMSVKSWLAEHHDDIQVFYLMSVFTRIESGRILRCDLKVSVHRGQAW